MALALQQHLAPRTLKVSGFCSEIITVFRSILAGCKQSVAMTRVMLRKALDELVRKHKAVTPTVHVDDTSMLVHGHIDIVVEQMAECLADFIVLAKNLHLKISDKSAIVSGSPKLAKQLQKR